LTGTRTVAFLALIAGGALAAQIASSPSGARATRAHEPSIVGHSVRGRLIRAIDVGPDSDRGANILVIGCIHGSEPAGIAIARSLIAHPPPHSADLWVVPDLNPDGVAAGTRQNGHGVDLNRNFPWHWRPLERPGGLHYSGPRVLSEPESRFAYHLIRRLRPRITIWFHQPLDVVDESGGNPRLEQKFATLAGLPFRRLPRYPGSAASWQNHTIPGTSAFVVELPPGPLSPSRTRELAEAVLDLTGESTTT
jgi:protein MpaA